MQANREILWLMVILLLFGPLVAPVYARQVPDLSEQIDAYLTRVEKERGLDAAGIMRLVDQGKLSVTDTLGEYFPDVPADKAGITLHHRTIASCD